MNAPSLIERPSRMAFGRLLIQALEAQKRIVHSSGADGVYVKGNQPDSLHRLELTYYPVHSMLGPLLPRLLINRAAFDIPASLIRKWSIAHGRSTFLRDVSLEFTFLPDESEMIAEWTPLLIQTLEDPSSKDWSRDFPLEVRKTSDTNIWTKTANEHATECARSNGAFKPRRAS